MPVLQQPTRAVRRVTSLLVVTVLGFAAPAHAVPAGDQAPLDRIAISTQLRSADDDVYLSVLGNDPAVEYGTLRLVGDAEVDDSPATVEVVVGLEYRDGSGPWSGFLTIDSPTRGLLAMSYAGRTTLGPDGSSRISGRLTVIGGTGTFADVAGSGTTRAVRDGNPGSATSYRIDVALRDGPPTDAEPTARPRPVAQPTDVVVGELVGVLGDQHFTALPGGTTYGIGRLTGSGSDVQSAAGAFASTVDDIELLGVVDYIGGEGPFTGFITLVATDGSRIGMRYAGVAVVRDDGSTVIRGEVTVIATSGSASGLGGRGSVRAVRSGKVGSPLEIRIALALTAHAGP